MLNKVYVLIGTTWVNYESSCSWVVKVFTNKTKANKYCQRFNARLRAAGMKPDGYETYRCPVGKTSEDINPNPMDKNFTIWDGTEYTVETSELI